MRGIVLRDPARWNVEELIQVKKNASSKTVLAHHSRTPIRLTILQEEVPP